MKRPVVSPAEIAGAFRFASAGKHTRIFGWSGKRDGACLGKLT
ncbi:hypothetical protein [Sphingopyxis flava]|nr:hypothetical protein [Sphingopyxis flava]